MSRLQTMSRFAEPDEDKPVCTCDNCDSELFKGDTVYEFAGDHFCSHDCIIDFIDPIIKTL